MKKPIKINGKRLLLILGILGMLGVGVITVEGVWVYVELRNYVETHTKTTEDANAEVSGGELQDSILQEQETTTLPETIAVTTSAAVITVNTTSEPSKAEPGTSAPKPSASSAPPSAAPSTTKPPSQREILAQYTKAVNARRTQNASVKKTITTNLDDFNCPALYRWVLNGKLPIINVDAGEYSKQLFGQGVKESSGTAAKLRTPVTPGIGDVQGLVLLNSGRQIKFSIPAEETNPTASNSLIGKVTSDFPSAAALSSDIFSLVEGSGAIVKIGAINVTTRNATVTADFSADGKLIKETITFNFVIRMESVSVGTESVSKIVTLPWGEAPGMREIALEYK
ncbi:MAG: hypothetical protein LBT21_05360 [Oscillospiraceae bacterium]|nr:hypothetical protein [Oscillospiraceae bacterium]